jgi:hypothetical protein
MRQVENVIQNGVSRSIVEILKENGKSGSTVKTYTSMLNCYLNEINNGRVVDVFYTNPKETITHIKSKYNIGKCRSLYSAILATIKDTNSVPALIYRGEIRGTGLEILEQDKKQEPTQKQIDNWVTQDEIKAIYAKLEANSQICGFQEYQDYVILSLYTLMSPRRLLDYTEMVFYKPVEYPELYNYIDWENKQFVFNIYKSKSKYETQLIDIPTKLFNILKKWLHMNKDTRMFSPELPLTVLCNKEGNKMEQSVLTKRLNCIFDGKQVSCNMLRHSFISSLLENTPKLTKLESVAREMAHSAAVQQLYRKINVDKKLPEKTI